MKKGFLFVLLISLFVISVKASTDNELNNLRVFSEGFTLAFQGLDAKEYKIQGLDEESVEFEEFMVVIDGSGLDDSRRFSLQLIGFRYDDSVRVTHSNWIVLSSFSRKANALSLVKSVNDRYLKEQPKNRRAFVYQKPIGQVFYREKSFYSKIAEIIFDDIKNNEKILFVEKEKKIFVDKNEEEKKRLLEQKKQEQKKQEQKARTEKNKINIEKIDLLNKKTEEIEKNLTKKSVDLSDKKELTLKIETKVEAAEKKNKKSPLEIARPVKVFFKGQKVDLYALNEDLLDDGIVVFIPIGPKNNVGKEYYSPVQIKGNDERIYYFLEKMNSWIPEDNIVETVY